MADRVIKNNRESPYHIYTDQDWEMFLDKKYKIPMNQRKYSWDENNITRFMDDLIEIFEDDKYFYKMGSIIVIKSDDGMYEVYDGQQRILTTQILLFVIGQLFPKRNEDILDLLTIKTDNEDITHNPKTECVNLDDNNALQDIFNNKYQPWLSYLNIKGKCEKVNDIESFECKTCKIKTTEKKNFLRHLKEKHKYELQSNKDSKLYTTYDTIYEHLALKRFDEKKMEQLHKYITRYIKFQVFDVFHYNYVSKIFDWENNRGKPVDVLDIIKNSILVRTPGDKREEVYDEWEKLRNLTNPYHKKDYGEKLFHIAMQIKNEKITRKPNIVEEFEKLYINKTDDTIFTEKETYNNTTDFFEIVKKINSIVIKISEDKYGKLISGVYSTQINWEAYMWGMIPAFYKTNNVNKSLLCLLAKWYLRNLQFKTRTLNNMSYSTTLIDISNKVLDKPDYDYLKDIKNCLQKHMDDKIKGDNYTTGLGKIKYKVDKSKSLLSFIEIQINTDEYILPNGYTIEHIHPQSNKDKLGDFDLINSLGNLTLLEGKNSKNGHQGNSALGNKKYEDKKQSYTDSSCKLTREISEKYEVFGEKEIKEREKEIFELLNKHTDYEND
jgi:uncharacterized protein with ParB-like and HNH nuclease domain